MKKGAKIELLDWHTSYMLLQYEKFNTNLMNDIIETKNKRSKSKNRFPLNLFVLDDEYFITVLMLTNDQDSNPITGIE